MTARGGVPPGRITQPALYLTGRASAVSRARSLESSDTNAGMSASEVMYPVIHRPDRWPLYGTGMWIVELTFSAEPQRLAARPDHRERLTQMHRAGLVRIAGPWSDDTGALIVFDVPDEAALNRLLAEDPYFHTPGVTVTARREWHPFLT